MNHEEYAVQPILEFDTTRATLNSLANTAMQLLDGVAVGAVAGVVDEEKDGKKAVTIEIKHESLTAKLPLILVCGGTFISRN